MRAANAAEFARDMPLDLGVTETTVKVHRSNMMHKFKAASLAELCRMAERLQLAPKSPDGQ
jgi:FixJ family two-component response regulator